MINVWFVELLRKFNLLFSIINPGTEGGEESFSNVSLALTGLNTIVYNQDLLASAVSRNWDLLIVDEAHHLVQGTPQFSAIEALSSSPAMYFF
jgi:ATP-dependent helicase HepA